MIHAAMGSLPSIPSSALDGGFVPPKSGLSAAAYQHSVKIGKTSVCSVGFAYSTLSALKSQVPYRRPLAGAVLMTIRSVLSKAQS
jgi:hypothetical protein